MKILSLAALTFALSTPSAFAGYNCLEGQEVIAAAKMSAVIQQSVIAALSKKGIALKEGSITVKGAFRSHSERDDNQNKTTTWGYYAIDDGRATSASGTEFDIVLSGTENPDDTYFSFYLQQFTHKGFDREGNPIEGHCTLKQNDPYVSNIARTFTVRNARFGQPVATGTIPATLSVY